MMIGLNGP